MTFVRALIRADRWREWHLSIPIYDGRNCPECGALCVGKGARRDHQAWHMRRTEWDSTMMEAVRRTAIAAGLKPRMMAADDSADGLYEHAPDESGYVNLRELGGQDDDDEEDDDE
jgi:hypothetical protein